MTERIDSHHHLWKFNQAEYGWIDDRMSLLRRDFMPIALEAELASTGIDGAVVVQARQTLDETNWLLALADDSPILRGVVGWAPLASDDFSSQLDRLREYPKLKGLRHIVRQSRTRISSCVRTSIGESASYYQLDWSTTS